MVRILPFAFACFAILAELISADDVKGKGRTTTITKTRTTTKKHTTATLTTTITTVRRHKKTKTTPTPTPTACADISGKEYKDSNGVVYAVHCAHDLYGNDISAQGSVNFVDCFGLCDSISGCVSFAFAGGNGLGTCYFKSQIGDLTANAGVQAAYIASKAPPPTTTTPAGPVPTHCDAIGTGDYKDYNGVLYSVHCQHDLYGNDISNVGPARFGDCFGLCDELEGCVSFAYAGGDLGTCYLKSFIGDLSVNQGVQAAYKVQRS